MSGEKVFDKREIDRMHKGELYRERSSTERQIRTQIQHLERLGPTDKYHDIRRQHLRVLYEKRSYIEKRIKELNKG